MNTLDPRAWLLAFVVYFCIFTPLESLVPHRRLRRFREGFLTDLCHFFLNGVLRRVCLAVLIVPVIYVLGFLVYPPLQTWVQSQPWWLQFAAAVLIQEVGAYWGHRLTHTVPFLWRFHAVHHSSEQMDWLAAARAHPFDQAFIRTCGFIPLYLLGFSKETFGLFIVIEGILAIFIHANVRIRFGLLERLIATPAFHHWHHTNDDPSLYDKNFAGLLPAIDWLFGTYYLPDRLPERYGVSEALPSSYLGQLAFPFRRRRAAVVAAPTETASGAIGAVQEAPYGE